jgi:hypothetical protein
VISIVESLFSMADTEDCCDTLDPLYDMNARVLLTRPLALRRGEIDRDQTYTYASIRAMSFESRHV